MPSKFCNKNLRLGVETHMERQTSRDKGNRRIMVGGQFRQQVHENSFKPIKAEHSGAHLSSQLHRKHK
jgi:hypothetical protein